MARYTLLKSLAPLTSTSGTCRWRFSVPVASCSTRSPRSYWTNTLPKSVNTPRFMDPRRGRWYTKWNPGPGLNMPRVFADASLRRKPPHSRQDEIIPTTLFGRGKKSLRNWSYMKILGGAASSSDQQYTFPPASPKSAITSMRTLLSRRLPARRPVTHPLFLLLFTLLPNEFATMPTTQMTNALSSTSPTTKACLYARASRRECAVLLQKARVAHEMALVLTSAPFVWTIRMARRTAIRGRTREHRPNRVVESAAAAEGDSSEVPTSSMAAVRVTRSLLLRMPLASPTSHAAVDS